MTIDKKPGPLLFLELGDFMMYRHLSLVTVSHDKFDNSGLIVFAAGICATDLQRMPMGFLGPIFALFSLEFITLTDVGGITNIVYFSFHIGCVAGPHKRFGRGRMMCTEDIRFATSAIGLLATTWAKIHSNISSLVSTPKWQIAAQTRAAAFWQPQDLQGYVEDCPKCENAGPGPKMPFNGWALTKNFGLYNTLSGMMEKVFFDGCS
jgi:hypothetical protein